MADQPRADLIVPDTHGPRSHTCGALRADDEGAEVTLKGWVDTRRDHGGLVFVDLRDRYGLTQVVFSPQDNEAAYEAAGRLRRRRRLRVPWPVSGDSTVFGSGRVTLLASRS